MSDLDIRQPGLAVEPLIDRLNRPPSSAGYEMSRPAGHLNANYTTSFSCTQNYIRILAILFCAILLCAQNV